MALLRSETRIYGNATVDTFLKIDGVNTVDGVNTGFPATSNSTGALRVTGGIGVKGNVFSSGNVTANFLTGTLTTANQYNITDVGTLGNVTVTNNANVGILNATDGVFTGNVTINGNFIYANVLTLNIKDPIIEQGGSTDGTPLTTNDSKDRGQLLHYYSGGGGLAGSPVDAFLGWDNSNSEFAFGSNVSVTGDVVTFNTFGNVRVKNVIGNLVGTADTAQTVTASAQANITSLGTLGNLTVSGNISGLLTTANQYNITSLGTLTGVTLIGPAILGNVANVTVYGGSSGQYLTTDGNGNVTWSSVTTGNANIAGADKQLFFNDNGSNTLGTSANLTFNKNTSTLAVANITANIQGNLTGNVYGNFIGNTYGDVVGNVTGNLTGNVYGNVIGAVSGNISVTGGTGEIEFVGSTGNLISSPNLTFTVATNTLTANYFSGNGSLLTSLTGANVSGNVSYAITSNWANVANSVSGTNVSGNVNSAVQSHYANIANSVSFTNITSTPTTISGYGITDSYSNTDAGAYLTTYSGSLAASNVSFTGANVSLGSNANIKITGGTNGTVLSTDGSGNLSWITATAVGNAITLGTSTDTDLVTPGAITTWTTATKVTDAIDDLNETLENVRNSTYVKSVTFIASPTAGGAGTSVTLTITSVGSPNRYDITWGDGTQTLASTSSTPSHTYSTNTNSPFTVTVRAYNLSGTGTGSEASFTRTAYITIYTANPVVGFSLYRGSTGGLALTGSNLYASEGETIYLDNTTTNTTGASVTYSINWGDSSTPDTISSDSVLGGVGGGRISHSYASGQHSGTGTKTITVTITSHSTATPAYIATGPNSTAAIKVYNPSIASPNGLSAKTITFQTSVGTSPYLAANYANNAGAAVTITAGSSISRVTSGTPVETIVMPTYAYNADSGYLRAVVNNTEDGNIALTTGSQAGTNLSLVLSAESDYNLLDATGTAIAFSASIYSPSLYKGFTAKVSKTNSALTAGLNTFKLSHSSTGNTNIIEFVKDDVTSVPTIDVSTATLSNATNGTYRYISGVPYYNTGSPTITLAGANIYNWIGQTYQNTTTPFQIEPGTNDESTSGSVVASQTRTYTQIDGSTTLLSGGIPKANTGNTSGYQYTLGSITANITTSSVASVQTIKFLATNVNGSSAYATHSKKVQVFTATPSGFVEESIPCSIGGDNTVAKRIVLSGSGATRSYTGGGQTNFYSSAVWSGVQTVAGTDSAIVRWNQLKWFNTDLSGYLPAGPNLNTGRSGTQYFFGAFTRAARSGFTVTITGKISGLRFAIPGVTDSLPYTTNGWLDATVVYFGSGVAGANDSGCAATVTVPTGSVISGTSYAITFGEGSTSSTGNWSNQVLFSIALASGDYVSSWSFS